MYYIRIALMLQKTHLSLNSQLNYLLQIQVLDKHLFAKTCICQDFHLTWCCNITELCIRWHMTKLQIKSDRITSFGGIYLVNR